ncbi:MAG: hypothetical protein GW856_02785 [Cyanobacteria bacterium]|nr:hypothetical protein [Cyanobacteria bacterium CG_2015-16_32_12]
MTALIDDLGVWVQLGTIQPSWDWIPFPVSFSTNNSIFRIKFIGDFSKITTFLYLRVTYSNTGINNFNYKWTRIYPNEAPTIIDLPINQIFLTNELSKIIEIRKASKWYGYKIPISDILYFVSLEAFIPFPETIKAINNIPQLQGVINDQLTQLKQELTVDIASNITNAISQNLNNINQQNTTIITLLTGII